MAKAALMFTDGTFDFQRKGFSMIPIRLNTLC